MWQHDDADSFSAAAMFRRSLPSSVEQTHKHTTATTTIIMFITSMTIDDHNDDGNNNDNNNNNVPPSVGLARRILQNG